MNISQLPKSLSHQVTEEYIDLMGHMNIHYYVKLFNSAALSFFTSFGLDEDYFNTTQNGVFVLEQHIRYIKEVRLGDRVNIHFRALGRSNKVLHYLLFMVHEKDNSLASASEFVSAHIDKANRLTSLIPADILEGYDQILAEHKALDWEAPVCGFMGPKSE